jgi:hypothetical protein
MAQLNGELSFLLRTILEDVCSHLPLSSTSARTLVASRSLECAHGCEQTYEDLSQAGLEALHARPRCGDDVRVPGSHSCLVHGIDCAD